MQRTAAPLLIFRKVYKSVMGSLHFFVMIESIETQEERNESV